MSSKWSLIMGLQALRIEDLPHYTYDDYVQWEGRWEVISGIPYAVVPMPTIEHQDMSGEIYHYLRVLLKNCPNCRPFLPVDWRITEDTVVQPDVLVVCGKVKRLKGKKLEIPPAIVFEILSPSTTRKDRIIKYRLYQEAGVKYYCIVDPETRSAEVYELQDAAYKKKDNFKDGKIHFDVDPCGIDFDFSEIFKG